MATKAVNYWRSMLSRARAANNALATSTSFNTRHFSSAAKTSHADHSRFRDLGVKGEYAPVYIVMGFVLVALTMGAHTAKQQLMHFPSISISKKKRETLREMDHPDNSIRSADKFINKSFLRKLAHIQVENPTSYHHDSSQPNPFTRSRNAETLKSAGVNTKSN